MTLLEKNISTTLLEGGRGEIKIILYCFQLVYYDLTISLNIFCEGLLLCPKKVIFHSYCQCMHEPLKTGIADREAVD